MRNITAKIYIEREINGETCEIEVALSGAFTRGCPEVRYLRNGDPGYPAEPDEVELTEAKDADTGAEVELTKAEAQKAEDALFEAAYDNADSDDRAEYEEQRAEERREMED